MVIWRRMTVLRLSIRPSRTKRLTVRSIQHWRLIALWCWTILRRRSLAVSSVKRRSWDEGGLRGDRMEEADLVESYTILATTVWRAVITRAANLCHTLVSNDDIARSTHLSLSAVLASYRGALSRSMRRLLRIVLRIIWIWYMRRRRKSVRIMWCRTMVRLSRRWWIVVLRRRLIGVLCQ